MLTRRRIVALAYGTVFTVLLPCFLVLWATATHDAVEMPAYGTRAGGLILVAGGGTLMLLGLLALLKRGGGFISPLPPERLVTSGVYRWLPHPMYLGFALATLGVAMFYRSPSGLWLVAPAVMLGCAARVFGQERPGLERRFAGEARDYLWLPADREGPPAGMARIRCYLFLLLPWVAIYEIIVWSGAPRGSFTLPLPGEETWAVYSWAEPLYMSTYVVVTLAPLLARTSGALRAFMIRAWLAMAISFSLYLLIPVVAPLKPFTPVGFWGHALAFERTADPPLNAFPSFHTIWAVLSANLLVAGRGSWSRRLGPLWAAGVAVCCVATGMHWVADVAAGLLLSFGLIHGGRLWKHMLAGAGRLSAWLEHREGAGFGLAAGIFVLVAAALAGTDQALAIAIAATGAMTGAAVGSWMESGRFRPESFFGATAGAAVGTWAAASWTGASAIAIAAALAAAAPWARAITLLRERPGSATLAAAAWNLFTGAVAARMWWAACPWSLVAGISLLLAGLGRFVETGHAERPARREQALSAVLAFAGAALTAFPGSGDATPPAWTMEALVLAALAALVTFGWTRSSNVRTESLPAPESVES